MRIGSNKKADKKYVLLTATIDPSVYSNVGSVITDAGERLSQYESSLCAYIEKSAFTDIVMAENSGYPFDKEYFSKLARKYNKRFEYLNCPCYKEETTEYGKSYGESRLMNDALEHSRLLADAATIYKVTGRVFLKNSRGIVKTINKHRNEFLIVDKYKWCYTHVFKFNKEDYLKYFAGAYERMPKNRINLEHNYYAIIEEHFEELDIGCFDVWPYVLGRHGTTGASYTSSFKGRIYHDCLCICNAYTHGSRLAGILTL